MESTGLHLTGYKIDSVIRKYEGRVTYRARRLEGDMIAVAVETLDAEYPNRQQVAMIHRDGLIAQRLTEVDGVYKIYAMLPHGSGNLALVGELFESSLQSHLKLATGALPLAEVLDIAMRLVHTLKGIHDHDIVHKALTPGHILFDPETGKTALAGFGIASELDQERQAVQMSRHIDGPLPYISPEQTGRMNRDLDYRSDYYSLGILLFELLTGSLPFEADTPLEWIHSHISRLPPAPHEISPLLPEALSAIILKLLAKSPEARYQSASGLMHDLAHCADLLAMGKAIEPFELGEKDVLQKFLLPQHLYGREQELNELIELFESAAAGGSEFCLIHGFSGVGKSALVNELDRPLVRERGFLIQGKFQQFQQGEAYMAFATAFRCLVHQVLAESEERLAEWRWRLLDALAPNTRLVVELIPELELIVGHQPEVPELPPAEASIRLHIVLTHFLQVFAGEGHPVVLFLDDLQWSDIPSLELLRRLVTSSELNHLLLIGAFRSNEVGTGHPLHLLLEDLQTQKSIRQLPLGPLDRKSVAQLVADGLCREHNATRSLSDMLFEKARGNPFFTIELLRQLHKDGVITPDPASRHWNWNMDAAHWLGVSNNVVEFMVDNLRRLHPATQKALQLAACIGNTFDLQTLAVIYERPATETATALLPALRQHAILPLHSDYRLVSEGSEQQAFNPIYRFQHDRVQQAAYALINPQRLPEVHLSIGRMMLQHTGEEVPDERLIDIVGHLNKGRGLIDSADERLQLAELNLRAGLRAKHSAAYEASLNYLRVASVLLPAEPWKKIPMLMRKLATEIQQCTYLTGRIEESENWIEALLEHAESDLERSDILAIRTRQYATLGRMEESISSAIQGLSLLGVQFTEQPTVEDISRERQRVETYLGDRKITELVDSQLVEEPATLTTMRLFMELFAATFLSGSGNLFPYLVLKAVNLSLRHGNCPESAFAYAAYGMLLCGELDEPATGYEYGKVGLAINERLGDVTLRARVIYVYAMFVHHWSNHWSSLTPWFRKGIETGYQSGDLLYLAYSAQDCVIWDPTLDLEAAHRLHAENMKIVRECAYQDSLDSGTLYLQLQRNLLGLTDSPYSLSDEDFDESVCLEGMRQRQFMTGIANYHIYSAEICLLYGDYNQALVHVREQDNLVKSAMSLPQLVRFYIVAFLTLVTHYPQMDTEEQGVTRERLENDLVRMRRWADNCEENYRHLQYLMEAELMRLDGTCEAALEHFDVAIDAARESAFLRDEAMACERAAGHLLSLGRRRAAEGYLRAARHLYDRWGARRKVAFMEQKHPILRELSSGNQASTAMHGVEDLDIASVMKASREISGEIMLESLLKTTMSILLENAGGQWGCLVVRQDGHLMAKAAKLPREELSTSDLPAHLLIRDQEGNQIPLPMTIISQVLHNGEAVVLRDAAHEGQFTHDPYVHKFKPMSVFCIPIRRGQFEGALYMENNLADGVFTVERVEVIRLLIAQAAVAIENARLYEQVQDYSRTLEEKVAERTERLQQLNRELQRLADRDGLTGVANRRWGDSYLQEAWLRLRREKRPLSTIMLDVDHFKAFNDKYGHQAGDSCLVRVAEAVGAQLLRPADLVVRYGGEEFMVILPDTDHDGATQVGEKIRSAVERLAIKHAQSSAGYVITVSVGVATMVPETKKGPNELLREADIALYQAKQMGRNQVRSSPHIAVNT